jgi:hypothetical protein
MVILPVNKKSAKREGIFGKALPIPLGVPLAPQEESAHSVASRLGVSLNPWQKLPGKTPLSSVLSYVHVRQAPLELLDTRSYGMGAGQIRLLQTNQAFEIG